MWPHGRVDDAWELSEGRREGLLLEGELIVQHLCKIERDGSNICCFFPPFVVGLVLVDGRLEVVHPLLWWCGWEAWLGAEDFPGAGREAALVLSHTIV